MTRAVATFIGRFAAIRVRWLICFTCFTAGWVSCAAWVFVLAYAPGIAVDLIARAGGLQ